MKKLFCIICFLCVGFPSPASVAAPASEHPGIRVSAPDRPDVPVYIKEEAITAESISLIAKDPNFKDQPAQHFRGIPLSRVAALAGINDLRGITVIGKDQYAVHLPWSMVSDTPAMIACQADGKKIGAFRGGPLKLVFPEALELHESAYAWYVETIVPDTWKNPFLKINNLGRVSRITAAEMDRAGTIIKKTFLSMPTGFNKYMEKPDQPAEISALPVFALLPNESLYGKQITFVPYAGKSVTLCGEPPILEEILIVYRINGRPVHPAHGGPFSVYFPVLSHPDLEGRVPGSGALFFLKEIIVK